MFPRAEVEALLEKDKPVTLTARQFWEKAHPTGSAEVIDALVAAHLADNPFEALKAVAAKYQL